MRLFGARRKRLSAPDFSRILISSRNHCKSSKKFARPGTDDARRKLKPLMNTDEHGAAQPQPKNERLRTHWWQVWSSAFRLHWTEQAKARTPNLTAETQVVRKNRSAGVSPASEPRQLLLGQHDLCRLEAGDTFFLTTAVSAVRFGVQALACYGRRAAWRLRSKPGTMSSWSLVFWFRLR